MSDALFNGFGSGSFPDALVILLCCPTMLLFLVGRKFVPEFSPCLVVIHDWRC